MKTIMFIGHFKTGSTSIQHYFARNWLAEFNLGMPTLNRMRRTWADSDMERTGKLFRDKFGMS